MPGGSPDDLTFAPGGILNLGGNLSEWGEDAFGRIGEASWSGRPLLVDPVCRTGDSAVFRGGGWSLGA